MPNNFGVKIKNVEVCWAFHPWWHCFFPFPIFEEDEKRHFMPLRLKFVYYKNKPSKTQWIYDWTLDLGWLHVWKKA